MNSRLRAWSTTTHMTWMCIVVGMTLSLVPAQKLVAAPIDLMTTDISDLMRVAQVGDIVGLTFTTTSMNVGTDHINWAWPVKETAATPWVVANGMFSGGSEGFNHRHDTILPLAPNPGHFFYGPHPHIQLFLFCQLPGGGLHLIGTSQLKHTFATADPGAGGDANPHFMGPGEQDSYSFRSNRDRDFFGPVSEINAATFAVTDHDHMGTRVMVPDPADPTKMIPLTENGFNVYERDHGEKEHAGNAIEHLLQVHADNINPALLPAGTKLFGAASYFVVGDNTPALLMNNTRYREIDPATFRFIGASMPGPFLAPRDQFVAPSGACVPEPSTLALFGTGTLGLLGFGWRRRKLAA